MRANAERILSAIIALVALASLTTPAAATEKYWIAHEAQLIGKTVGA